MNCEEKVKKQRIADLQKADREAGSLFSNTPLAYVLLIAFSIILTLLSSLSDAHQSLRSHLKRRLFHEFDSTRLHGF
mgnify:CR=1 FL=1